MYVCMYACMYVRKYFGRQVGRYVYLHACACMNIVISLLASKQNPSRGMPDGNRNSSHNGHRYPPKVNDAENVC